MRQRLLQLLLHCLLVGLPVIPVVEATEWPAHRACHAHQGLLSFEELHRLGSLSGQVEVPGVAFLIHRREVEGAPGL